MTQGFTDSASIHSALAALALRGDKDLSSWDRQSLLDTTYLLLFRDIGVVPGPGGYRGASGLFSHVVSRLPSLEATRFRRDQALRSTRAWLTRRPDELGRAFRELQAEPSFPAWAAITRKLFWSHHVRMHESLFNKEFVQYIAPILGCTETELERIHLQSQDERTVAAWVKNDLAEVDARIAHAAYIISALIRGRYHEYMASGGKLHLLGHPFRQFVERPLRPSGGEPVFNSEEYFAKAIIGSALLETTEERRAKAWADNVAKGRAAIELKAVALPAAELDSDAERLAAEAAKRAGISGSYSRVRRELEVAAALGISGLLTLAVSPWVGPVGPIATSTYRHYRGISVGEDLASFFLDTRRRFRRLARSVPGRIVRALRV